MQFQFIKKNIRGLIFLHFRSGLSGDSERGQLDLKGRRLREPRYDVAEIDVKNKKTSVFTTKNSSKTEIFSIILRFYVTKAPLPTYLQGARQVKVLVIAIFPPLQYSD